MKTSTTYFRAGMIAAGATAVAMSFMAGLPAYAQTPTPSATPTPTQSVTAGAPAFTTTTVTGNTDSNYTLLEPLPCLSSTSANPCTPGTLQSTINFKGYIQYIFNLAIAIAAVMAVFMIVWGGLQYMSTDSFQGKSDGLEKVKNAVLGLLLVLCSYIILRTIDPRFVNIPDTLVTPLTLSETSSSGLFAQPPSSGQASSTDPLTQAGQFNAQAQQSVVSAQQNQATIAAAQQNITNLQAQLNSVCAGQDLESCQTGNPAAQQLATQIATYTNQMYAAQASEIVNSANSTLTLAVSQNLQNINALSNVGTVSPDSVEAAADKTAAFIDQTRNTMIGKLDAIGAYDQEAKVQAQADYDTVLVRINKVNADISNISIGVISDKYYGTRALGSDIKSTVSSEIGDISLSSVSDSTMRADLQTRIQALTTALNAKIPK